MSAAKDLIRPGDIVIGRHKDSKDAFLRWRVESMNVGQGKRWSYIVDYPLVKGQEPIMIETAVLLSNCRKATQEEVDAIVVVIPTKEASR